MREQPANFCRWLREELEAEAAGRRERPPAQRPAPTVQLSDLEALGLLIVCMERQSDAGLAACTTDLALQLAVVLLARLRA